MNISLINGSMNGVDTLRQVEAKYPALLFKQQLTAYVEKIYGMIRDNLKKEISPLLGLCIQVYKFGFCRLTTLYFIKAKFMFHYGYCLVILITFPLSKLLKLNFIVWI